jgi:hypothetical protein
MDERENEVWGDIIVKRERNVWTIPAESVATIARLLGIVGDTKGGQNETSAG